MDFFLPKGLNYMNMFNQFFISDEEHDKKDDYYVFPVVK